MATEDPSVLKKKKKKEKKGKKERKEKEKRKKKENTHTQCVFNPSSQNASLVYIVSSRTARAK